MNGLTLIENYISDDDEQKLIKKINNQTWDKSLKRLTQHYGYKYDYKSSKIGESIGDIPSWLTKYTDKMIIDKHINKYPDQVIINRYLPGEGISAHIDRTDIFDNKIYSLSLGSSCVMIFENRRNKYEIHIKPKTLLIMEDDARYFFKHSILPKTYDIVDKQHLDRDTRYSITFRNVIKT